MSTTSYQGHERRRHAQGKFEDAPWYVRFTLQVGVPAALAVGLTFFLTLIVRTNLSDISRTQAAVLQVQQSQSSNMSVIVENQHRIIELLNAHEQAQAHGTAVMLALCLNSADELGTMRSTARDRCLSYIQGNGR